MSKLGLLLIAMGGVCLLHAASADNYYETIGQSYPLINIAAWIGAGAFGLLLGYKMIKER